MRSKSVIVALKDIMAKGRSPCRIMELHRELRRI
jgi:hypothetical protein